MAGKVPAETQDIMTNEERHAKDAEQTKAILEYIAKQTAVQWHEDFKTTGELVMFDAEGYHNWAHSILPEHLRKPKQKETPVGDFIYRFFRMPLVTEAYWGFGPISRYLGMERSAISLGPRRGSCCFNQEVKIPQLVTKDRKAEVWMSLTPMEILTQRPGLKKARGRVLVGGLGMGWFARRCCERKQVESVTVFELNAEVIENFKFDHPKLKINVGNVFEEKTEKYDSVLLDVWDSYGDAECDRDLGKILRVHKNVWAWGNVTSGLPYSLWS